MPRHQPIQLASPLSRIPARLPARPSIDLPRPSFGLRRRRLGVTMSGRGCARHRKETSMADVSGFPGLKLRQRPPGSARVLHPQLSPFLAEYRAKGEAALTEPFKGVTADGAVVRDL